MLQSIMLPTFPIPSGLIDCSRPALASLPSAAWLPEDLGLRRLLVALLIDPGEGLGLYHRALPIRGLVAHYALVAADVSAETYVAVTSRAAGTTLLRVRSPQQPRMPEGRPRAAYRTERLGGCAAPMLDARVLPADLWAGLLAQADAVFVMAADSALAFDAALLGVPIWCWSVDAGWVPASVELRGIAPTAALAGIEVAADGTPPHAALVEAVVRATEARYQQDVAAMARQRKAFRKLRKLLRSPQQFFRDARSPLLRRFGCWLARC